MKNKERSKKKNKSGNIVCRTKAKKGREKKTEFPVKIVLVAIVIIVTHYFSWSEQFYTLDNGLCYSFVLVFSIFPADIVT